MSRRNFCELGPWAYRLSVWKGILIRKLKWIRMRPFFAKSRNSEPLPIKVYNHKSLIRRKLGNVDMELQNNKATNLTLAAPKINAILIKPGEVFSFWYLVGTCTKRKGFKVGLVIKSGGVSKDIGGGMCQFTNLLHWMILHSPLDIIEHHHHNDLDMFPDYGRQVPFGSGTSIMYNYLDYQVKNNTSQTFQILVYTNEDYLCGELRCEHELPSAYHVVEEDAFFSLEENCYYRNNKIYRKEIDKTTGNLLSKEMIMTSHAKVLYDASFIPEDKIKKSDASRLA